MGERRCLVGSRALEVFSPELQGSSEQAALLFLSLPPTDLVWKHFSGHFLLLYGDKMLGSITEICCLASEQHK